MKYVHVNFMFNLQHFAIHNVSSAILYGAIGIDLLVIRQNSYGFERSGPRQCDVQLAMLCAVYGPKRFWSEVTVTVFKTSRHSKLLFFVKKQRTMERKKRSKGRGWESCYVKKIYGTFGVEMRAYG